MEFTRTLVRLITVASLIVGISMAVNAGASTDEPTEHVVEITGFKFVPETVSVKVGDTITWINKDIVPHTATANDATFDTGTLSKNESGSITVTHDQTLAYYCKFHPMMKATLAFE